MKRLNLIIDDYLHQKIVERANKEHRLISEVVREILRGVLEKEEAEREEKGRNLTKEGLAKGSKKKKGERKK